MLVCPTTKEGKKEGKREGERKDEGRRDGGRCMAQQAGMLCHQAGEGPDISARGQILVHASIPSFSRSASGVLTH